MKRIIFPLLLSLLLFPSFTYSQLKIGYVDSKTIMEKLPEAQDAQQKLNELIQGWKTEINKLKAERKAKQQDYDRRQLIMTEQTRNQLKSEIKKLDTKIDNFREEKFGTNGELFQKQEELMKPVQNKVFNAIQDVAKEENLDFVFDRSGDIMILYAKDKYDITQKVLDKLKLQ